MPIIAMTARRLEAEKAKEALISRGIPAKIERAGKLWFINTNRPLKAQTVLKELNLCRNPDMGNLSGVAPNPIMPTLATGLATGLGFGAGMTVGKGVLGRMMKNPKEGSR